MGRYAVLGSFHNRLYHNFLSSPSGLFRVWNSPRAYRSMSVNTWLDSKFDRVTNTSSNSSRDASTHKSVCRDYCLLYRKVATAFLPFICQQNIAMMIWSVTMVFVQNANSIFHCPRILSKAMVVSSLSCVVRSKGEPLISSILFFFKILSNNFHSNILLVAAYIRPAARTFYRPYFSPTTTKISVLIVERILR